MHLLLQWPLSGSTFKGDLVGHPTKTGCTQSLTELAVNWLIPFSLSQTIWSSFKRLFPSCLLWHFSPETDNAASRLLPAGGFQSNKGEDFLSRARENGWKYVWGIKLSALSTCMRQFCSSLHSPAFPPPFHPLCRSLFWSVIFSSVNFSPHSKQAIFQNLLDL